MAMRTPSSKVSISLGTQVVILEIINEIINIAMMLITNTIVIRNVMRFT